MAKRPTRKQARGPRSSNAKRTVTRKQPSKSRAAVAQARGAVAGAARAVARRLPGASGELDAIELLERDHRRFEELLAKGEATTEAATKTRRQILATLAAALKQHELMEEKVLYPALQAEPEARDVVLEGYEEHHVADLIVAELMDLAEDEQRWGPKFKVLKENIEHHIEEEEGEMFRAARGIFSREELKQMATRMLKLRRD